MTEREKLTHCDGCHNDHYNQPGNSTTGRCWSLPTMKLILRKPVHINDVPPWLNKSKLMPDCYRKPQWVFVKPGVSF